MPSPLHDVELPTDRSEQFPAMIEIAMGSRCKYAIDRWTGLLQLDRVRYSSTH